MVRSSLLQSTSGRVYKHGGESKHNRLPAPVLDMAFILPDGEVSWPGLLLSLLRG